MGRCRRSSRARLRVHSIASRPPLGQATPAAKGQLDAVVTAAATLTGSARGAST